jgi:hypothetical protein
MTATFETVIPNDMAQDAQPGWNADAQFMSEQAAEITRLRALVEEMGKGLVRIERMANTIQFNGNQQPIPHENHMRAWRDVETATTATLAKAKEQS